MQEITGRFVKLRTFSEKQRNKGERVSLSYFLSDFFGGMADVGRE